VAISILAMRLDFIGHTTARVMDVEIKMFGKGIEGLGDVIGSIMVFI